MKESDRALAKAWRRAVEVSDDQCAESEPNASTVEGAIDDLHDAAQTIVNERDEAEARVEELQTQLANMTAAAEVAARAHDAVQAELADERKACDEWRELYAAAVDPKTFKDDPYGAKHNERAERMAVAHDARRAVETPKGGVS